MTEVIHEYEVTVLRKNGEAFMYVFLDAESSFHALMRAKEDTMVQKMLERGELEPFEHWEVKDLTEWREQERLKINPQLKLF
ncbi:MAG: hypothetical protein ACP5D6_06375 [Kosmotogaceae bacterium]